MKFVVEDSLISFLPDEVHRCSQEVSENKGLEVAFKSSRSKVADNILQVEKVKLDMAFVETHSPNSSGKDAIKEEVVNRLTGQMAKGACWIIKFSPVENPELS